MRAVVGTPFYEGDTLHNIGEVLDLPDDKARRYASYGLVEVSEQEAKPAKKGRKASEGKDSQPGREEV